MKFQTCTGWGGQQYDNVVDAALSYYNAGLPIIPIVPDSKKTAVKWDPWLDQLSQDTIRQYWSNHPDHGIGFIVPENLVVFDADTPTAVVALYQIEETFDTSPSVIVKTRRGEHHYFRLETGTKVKTQALSTDDCPEGIDIKAPRSLVVLP